MEKLAYSPAERLKEVDIKPIEQECLDRVFNYLSHRDPKKPTDKQDYIGLMDLANTLMYLGLKPTRSQIKLMIWEVDDDLDEYVSKEEFMTMYKRCISDDTDLEPRGLFNLV